MDGANPLQKFWYLTLPHLARSIAVVVMIEMIFLLSVFAEIFTTTGGGPGNESTNLAFLIFKQALMNFDVGVPPPAHCSRWCWRTSRRCSSSA